MQKIDRRFIEFDTADPNAVTGDDIAKSSSDDDTLNDVGASYFQQDGAPTSMSQDSTAVITHESLSGIEGKVAYQVQELVLGGTNQNTTDIIAYADIDKWDLENVQGTATQLQHYKAADGPISTLFDWDGTHETNIRVDATSDTNVTHAGEQCCHMRVPVAGTAQYVQLETFPEWGDRSVISIRYNFDNLGTIAPSAPWNGHYFQVCNGEKKFRLAWWQSNMQYGTSPAAGTTMNISWNEDQWYVYKFDIDWVAGTCDIYRDDILLGGGGTPLYNDSNEVCGFYQSGPGEQTDVYIDYMTITTAPEAGGHFETAGDAPISIGFDAETVLLIQSDTTNTSQVFEDSSLSNHTIDYYNQVNHSTGITPQTGMGATSIYFDGTEDYLSIGNHPSINLSSGDFTIDFWIRPTSLTNQIWFTKGLNNGDANQSYSLRYDATEADMYWITSNGGTLSNAYRYRGVIDVSWQHMAIVRSGSNLTVYRNGVALTPDGTTRTPSMITEMDVPLQIGKYYTITNTYDYDGYMDEFRISKVAKWTSNFIVPSAPHYPWTGTEPKIQAGCQFKLDSDSTIYSISSVDSDGTGEVALTIDPEPSTTGITDVDWIRGNDIPETGDNADKLSLSGSNAYSVGQYYTATTNDSGQVDISDFADINDGGAVTEDISGAEIWEDTWEIDDYFSVGSGWTGKGVRHFVPASKFSNDGRAIKITFASSANGNLNLDNVWVGHRGAQNWDFDGNQVQVTFNTGSDDFTIGASSFITSDPIDFDLNSNRDVVISFDHVTGGYPNAYNATGVYCFGWNAHVEGATDLGTWDFGAYSDKTYGLYSIDVETNVSELANYYSISTDARDSYKIFNRTGSTWRDIARDNSGTWQYNNHPGENVIANQTFDSTTEGWGGTATLTSDADGQSGNGLKIANPTATQSYGEVEITGLTIGSIYSYSIYHKAGSNNCTFWVGPSQGSQAYIGKGLTTAAWNRTICEFIATSTSCWTRAYVASNDNGAFIRLDEFTLTEIGMVDATWADSTINSAQSAISQAIETHEANRMTGADYASIGDEEWNDPNGWVESQDTLDLAVTQTTNSSITPTVDNFTANYDVLGNYQMMGISPVSGEYTVERLTDTTTSFKKTSTGSSTAVYCTVIIG